MAPIRLGMIGLSSSPMAWANRAHVKPLKEQLAEKYKIVALGTSSHETAKTAAEFHGVPVEKAYHTPEAMANDPDVDMVVVAVKVPMHKQLTMPLLEKGKDVFVEWPLGADLAEATEMAALAKQKGVKTLVGLQNRLSPTILAAKQIIASGKLGRIVSSTLSGTNNSFHTLPASANYMNDVTSGASIVTILFSHSIDPILFALGAEFKHLQAITQILFPEIEVIDPKTGEKSMGKRTSPDWVAVTGSLTNGAVMTCNYGVSKNSAENHMKWVVSGTEGSLKLESDSWILWAKAHTLMTSFPGKNEGKWEEVGGVGEPSSFASLGDEYKAFADGDTSALVDFDEAVKRHAMLDAIYRSSKNGTRESYL